MNILICLNSGKHITYISSLFDELRKKNKLFITCYKDKKDTDYIDCINNLNIEEINFIVDTKFLTKFMRNYDEIMSLYKLLQHDNSYYSTRFLNFGSSIQKKILSNNFYKIILNLLFKLKILSIFRYILLIFLTYNTDVLNQFKLNKIDHCIVTPGNHKNSLEIEYLRIAKKLNIKSSAIIRSWDVLTTKSIFRYKPDLIFCWNEFHKDSLNKLHSIKNNIHKSGSLFFEKWFNKPQSLTINNTSKDQIIYFGSSEKIVRNLDAEIVINFNKLLQNYNKKTGKKFQIIFRPHPANNLSTKKIKESGIKVDPEDINNLPVKKDDQINFINSLKKCFFTIGINTSAMVDSIILGTPTIALIVKNENIIQYQSAHFRHIVDENIIYKHNTLEEDLENLFTQIKQDPLLNIRVNYVNKNIFLDGVKPSKLISKIINDI